jgi:hypothetical protein
LLCAHFVDHYVDPAGLQVLSLTLLLLLCLLLVTFAGHHNHNHRWAVCRHQQQQQQLSLRLEPALLLYAATSCLHHAVHPAATLAICTICTCALPFCWSLPLII